MEDTVRCKHGMLAVHRCKYRRLLAPGTRSMIVPPYEKPLYEKTGFIISMHKM